MTQSTRDVRTRVGYLLDTQSVATVIAGNQQIAASMAQLSAMTRQEFAKAGVDVAALTAQTQTLAQTQILNANNVASAQTAVNMQLREHLVLQRQLTAEDRAQAAFVTRAGERGNIGRTIGRVSRSLFNLPDVQLTPGLSTTTISRLGIGAGAGIEAAGLSVAALGAAALVAAPLIAGVVAVTGAYSRTAQEAAQNAKTFVGAITQALEAGTTAQIRALIKQKQQEIEIAEAAQQIALEKAKEAQAGLAMFLDRSSEDLADRLNQAAADLHLFGQTEGSDFSTVPAQSQEEFNAQAAEQLKIIEQGKIALEAYNLVLGRSVDNTVTAAAAEKELADIRGQLAEARKTREVEAANFVLAAERMTADERKKRAAELAEEIPILRAQANATDISVAAQLELITQTNRLEAEYNALIGVTDSYADRLARAAEYTERITTQYDNYLDALKLEVEIRDELTATIQKLNEIEAERDAKLRLLAQDDQEKRDDIERDATARREEIARESVERINKILRDGGREQLNAVASRDVMAFLLSKQRQTDQLADQKQADDKATANLARQIARQEEQRQRAYDRQYAQTVAAAEKELNAQRQHQAQLNVDLQNALAAEQAIALNGSGGLRVIHTNFWTDVNSVAVTYAANTVNTIRSIMNGLPGGGMPGGIPGYQPWGGQGGVGTANYMVPNFPPAPPEAMLPYSFSAPSPRSRGMNLPGGSGGGGMGTYGGSGGITLHYAPTVNGMDLRATLHAFDDRFIGYLRQSGVMR